MAYDKNRVSLNSIPSPYNKDEEVLNDLINPPIRNWQVGDIVLWSLKPTAAKGPLARNLPSLDPSSDWRPLAAPATPTTGGGSSGIEFVRRKYTDSNAFEMPFVPTKVHTIFLYNYDNEDKYTDFIPLDPVEGEITDGYSWVPGSAFISVSSLVAHDNLLFVIERGGSSSGGNNGGTLNSILDYLESGDNITFSGEGTKKSKLQINSNSTNGNFTGFETEPINGTDFPYTTLKKTTYRNIQGFYYAGIYQDKPNADNSIAPDYTITINPNDSATITPVGVFDTTKSGQIVYVATGDITNGEEPPPNNTTPVANAGTDVIITLPTESVQLNGTGTDAEGGIMSYSWLVVNQPSEASALFNDANIANPVVHNLTIPGVYTLRLSVTDNGGLSGFDEIIITVNEQSQAAPINNFSSAPQSTTEILLTWNNPA